jgi:hypothetical protein
MNLLGQHCICTCGIGSYVQTRAYVILYYTKVHVTNKQACLNVDRHDSKIKYFKPVVICEPIQAKDIYFIRNDYIKIGVLKIYIIKK